MKQKKLIAIILSAVCLLGEFLAPLQAGAAETAQQETVFIENSSYEEEKLEQMKKVAENEFLELYLDEKETGVAVREKSSGGLWFSNPPDGAEDDFSTAYYQKVLKSQLYVTYISGDTTVGTMNNYTSSIENGQFEIEEVENGVRITYFIGDGALALTFPSVITQQRMLYFLEQMTESQQKKIKRNYMLWCLEEMTQEQKEEMLEKYPLLEEENLYILRSGTKDYMKEELAGYFEEAGYTQEDFELDGQNNPAAATEKKPWFRIPLVYQLEGDTLTVTVNPKEVEYNTNGYYLVNIDILRYFGAALGEDGYLFVPDGSGALIRFANGKEKEASYNAAVYGQDVSLLYPTWQQSQIDTANTVKMPVYGVKHGEKALFAIIEEGDAYASVKADVAGKITGYNDVYASFSYLQYGEISLSDMVGAASYFMYAPAEFEGTYKIRYSFFSGSEADYSGMASCYREYLKEKGVLGEKVQEQNLPFYVEYIGAIDKPATFLGIKYDSVEAVTTFAQAKEITEKLSESGVENITIIYSGWMDGGLHGAAVTKCSAESKLEKGNLSLADFVEYTKETGMEFYATLDLQYVYRDGLFDGYSTMKYAPRYFDNTIVKIKEYGFASRVTEGEKANLISPYYAAKIGEKLSAFLTKKGMEGVGIGTLSWELFSDLQAEKYTDRQMAQKENCRALQTLKESGQKLLGDNANAYVWGYVSDLINAPQYSNHYRIIDEEIPFYEMVLHGYISYAGEVANLADDYNTAVLKSAESGAGLYFKWIYADNSALKDTEYDYLYSVNYEAWLETSAVSYERMNREMGYLSGCEILSHEILRDNVVKVTYEDGSRVYVNYTQEEVRVDGIRIPARDYVVAKEAA